MHLIPAIDLLDGRCVRLRHGDFEQCTFYDANPHQLADGYAAARVEWLHIVDLAASRDGHAANVTPMLELLRRARQKVQTGGGVRGADDVRLRLDAGADRVVVGSLCVSDPDLFANWLAEFGANRLVAALDVRIDEHGVAWPCLHGWTRVANRPLEELLDTLSRSGLVHLLCTDIGRDGALSGPNVPLYRTLTESYPNLEIQASGGVATIDDLQLLGGTGVASAICGKALLEHRFTVRQAQEVLQ